MRSAHSALLSISVAMIALLASPASAEEWPVFRGANGAGVSAATALPVEFGPEKNLVWQAEVPFGRSSPVIAGGRVFVTAAEGGRLLTLAFDGKSGEELWRRELERAYEAEFHSDTDSSTPTPASDGANVYALFHEFGLISYNAKGTERWRLPLGPFRNFYGIAASPVLAGDRLYVLCDQAEDSFLLAVDKNSGRELWRSKRAARLEAYSTPVLYPTAEAPELVIVSGSRWVDAYDPATGEVVWTLGQVGSSPISSPILLGDTLFVSAIDHAESGWTPFDTLLEEFDKDDDGELSRTDVENAWVAKHFGWLNSDGEGNLTEEDWNRVGREMVNDDWGVFAVRVPEAGGQPEKLWNYRQNIPYIPSPLVYDGVFYMVKDGMVTSLEPESGEQLKRGRLGGSSKVYASPIAGDGKIYIGTLEGDVAVLEAGGEWSVVATNSLGDEIWATPAIANGDLFVRTRGKLFRFGMPATEEAGAAE
jgi:outer membrane protein assembly factor BamB